MKISLVMSSFAVQACLGALLISGLVQAQPQKRPQFFEQDYPKKIMQGTTVIGDAPNGAATPVTAQDQSETGSHSAFESEPDLSPSPSPTPTTPVIDPRDKLEATPIRRISAVLDATDSEHYEGYLKQLVDAGFKFNLKVGEVYSLGELPPIKDNEVLLGIKVLGGDFLMVNAPPQKYPVKKSPTWIMKTVRGEIILEGFPELGRFLNSRGQYVPNTGMMDDAAE